MLDEVLVKAVFHRFLDLCQNLDLCRLCQALFGNKSKTKEFKHNMSIIASFCSMQVQRIHFIICHQLFFPESFNQCNIYIPALTPSFTLNSPAGTCSNCYTVATVLITNTMFPAWHTLKDCPFVSLIQYDRDW